MIVGFLLMIGGAHCVHALLPEQDAEIARDEIIDARERSRIEQHEFQERIEQMRQERNQRVREALSRPPQDNEAFTRAERKNQRRYPGREALPEKPDNTFISVIAILFAVISGSVALAAWYMASRENK
ncbi:MAG: hypothetical protein EOM20_02680 [Spartobacteria bacterium]|nr:hypothetical protein [Spartobacteria bacterium]